MRGSAPNLGDSTFRLVLFLLLMWAALQIVSAAPKDPFTRRISCGARVNVQTPPTNTLWYRDFGYTGGKPGNATRPSFISPKLNTLRYFTLSDGPENCYNIQNVPNGLYSVRLFFALVDDPRLKNEPLFDISIEGTQIYSMKQGWSNLDFQSFVEGLVSISDSSVSSCFHSTGHGDPAILSIEVLQVHNDAYFLGGQSNDRTILRTARRLACGNGRPSFDADLSGNPWGGDRYWEPIQHFGTSGHAISTESSIKLTSASPNFYPEKIYQYAIVSNDDEPDLTFNMDVEPNKNYSIWLHFAEIENQGPDSRVFDILVNGYVAFSNVDIVKITGGSNIAMVLNKTVAVSGRILTVTFHPIQGHSAIINAIEIFEVIPMEFRTSAVEVKTLQTLKNTLSLPVRFGWNGDPCVPQQHPWGGVNCQFNHNDGSWVIDGLDLGNQGLRGYLADAFSMFKYLEKIDLSYNLLNGTIPDSLGQLTSLQVLNLNGNLLSGRVPSALGGRPLHRASFNFTGNEGLCGIPGLPACGPHLSTSAKIGISFGVILAFSVILLCSLCMWKRRQNILRAKKLAAKEAPYAKARTHYVRDVQMTRTPAQDQFRVHADSGSQLLS
ncbi:unnamed protein product [Victoria cruziana]